MSKVSVQIVTYWTDQARAHLDALFVSLKEVQYPKDKWHIVIVDNPGPLGKAREYLEEIWMPESGQSLPTIEIIDSETNTGFSGGHNAAYEASKQWGADYLYLLNQDGSLDKDALREVVKYAENHPNCALVQSRIMLANNPSKLNSCGNVLHFLGYGYSDGYLKTPEEANNDLLPHFFLSGAALLIRTKHLNELGYLFDSYYFMYHEDVDLSWRARLKGFELGYAENSVAYHDYEFSRSIKKFYLMERNRHITNLTHYRFGTLLLILPAYIVMELGGLFFAFKSGWWKEKIQSWLVLFDPVMLMRIAKKRGFIQQLRNVSDKELLLEMTGRIEAQQVKNPILTYLVNPIMDMYHRALIFTLNL